MNKLIVRTNTVTNENYDEFGNFFSRGNPKISVNSTFRLEWYLYTDTPDANYSSVDLDKWIPDYSLAGYSALLTCDNDWVHRVSGTLESESISGEFPEQIAVKIASASTKNIAPCGKITLYNRQGMFQTVLYSEREIQPDGATVLLTIGSGVSADHEYSKGDSVTVSQEVYFEAVNIAELSEPENGKFVFDVVARSRKLQSLADTATSGNISIQGLEFMPFTADAETGEYIQAPAYLVDTAVLISTIGDPIVNAESSDIVKSEIAEFVSSMVKSKVAVSFSELKNGKIAISGKMNPPIGLITDKGNYYPVEKGTLTAVSGGWELEPGVYLAYDNSAEFGGIWTVYLGSDVSGGSGGGSSGGVAEEVFTQFREQTEQSLTDLNGKVSGMYISETENTAVPLVHNTVVKYSLTTDDVITVDTSAMTSDKSVTMELWLTMPETVVSFSIPNVTWIEEPSFDTANMLYCVVLRWDGERVLANVAYSVEVS